MTHFNREYRSTVFAMLFSDKKALLSLYNGVNGTDYENEEDIEINTLTDENGVPSGIFMKRKNDISFLFDSYLNLYEHQGTVCGNMPLRMLLYVSELLKEMFSRKLLYRSKSIPLPVPRFIVFYNGEQDMPDRAEYRLSEQYEFKTASPDLELKVTVFNINKGRNRELMEKCRTLREYSEFVSRTYAALRGKKTEAQKRAAMGEVIDGCIRDNILADFLGKNREVVMRNSILEYDEEAHMQAVHEDGFDEGYDSGYDSGYKEGISVGEIRGRSMGEIKGRSMGKKEGRIEGKIEGKSESILDILEERGTVPPELERRIRSQKDSEILSKWLKLAANSDSVQQFAEQM